MGLFDDVLEPPKPARKGGLFDDVLQAPPRAGERLNYGDPLYTEETIMQAGPSDPLRVPDYRKVFEAGPDDDVGLGESIVRGLAVGGERFNQLANFLGLGAGTIVESIPGAQSLAQALTGNRTPLTDIAGRGVEDASSQIELLSPKQNERLSLPSKVGFGAASSVNDLATALLTGGESIPAQAAVRTGLRQALASELEKSALTSARASVIPGATRGTEVGRQVIEQGGSPLEAGAAGATGAISTALTNIVPASASGNVLVRGTQGAASNPAADYLQSQLENVNLPEQLQNKPMTLSDVLVSALTGAPLAAGIGERGPDRIRDPETIRGPAPTPLPARRPFPSEVDVPRGTEIAPTPTPAPVPVAPPAPVAAAPTEITDGQAESEARTVQEAVQAPETGTVRPDEFTAKTKGGTFRLTDTEAPAGTDFSEFGQVREVRAFDGDTEIGKLVYANDGTPPTIEVNPDYRRKGVATAMLKLAKERGGVLGEGETGIRGRGAEYRTPEGQAFRSHADEGSVELSPFVTEQAQTPAISTPEPASEQVAEVRTEAAPAEPAPVAPPVRTTGIANADVAARREAEGRAPLIQEARRTNQETIDKAVSKTADNPRLAAETVAKLNSGQAATLDDEAILFVDAVNLRKQRDSALDVINDPDATDYAKEVANREYNETVAKIEANEQASKAVGTESGRLLQLRRRLLADDYSLIALERKVRQSQGGKPLSQEQTQKIRELSKKIEELTKRAEAAEAQTSLAESVATYDDLLKSMQAALKGPRKRPTLDKLRDAANESRAALAGIESVPSRKGQSGAAINPVAFYHLARIGAYHVANGAATLADFTARMRADIGAKIDEFREMLPAVFQAAKEQAKVSSAGPSVDQVLAKVTTPTAKDVKALAEAHIRAGLRGEGPVLEAVASSLNLPVADVRRLFVEPAKRGQPKTLDAAKAELRDLRNQLRKADAQNRAEMRSAQREAAKAPAKPPVDAETRYQETRNKDLRKRIADLESRIAAGDFAKTPPRVQRQLNRANEQAQLELEKAKEEFGRLQLEAEFAARTPVGKVLGYGRDTINLARALMTSLDFSGLLRQGGFISFGHPVRAARAVPEAIKAFASEKAELAARQAIEKRQNYRLYKQAGLELTGIGTGPLTKVEEAFASRLLSRVPRVLGGGLIRGSGRSYTTLLNRLRADSFDSMVGGLSKTEKPTSAEAKAIANYINVATGRGKIGTSENVGETLNTLFFAPRLVASRFQLLAGQPLYGGTNRTRNLIAQDYARFLMGVGTTLALASLMKDEDDDTPFLTLDPRSADFGKARFGNTYLDPLAGLAQVSTFIARTATGETKKSTPDVTEWKKAREAALRNGDEKLAEKLEKRIAAREKEVAERGSQAGVRPIRPGWTLTDLRQALGEKIPSHKLDKEGGLPFGSSDVPDVILRFLRTKLAPVPGAILNTVSGTDLMGKPTSRETLTSLVTPMTFNDVGKVMEEQGVPRGSAIWLLSLLGMGMQYRQPKPGEEAPETGRPTSEDQ